MDSTATKSAREPAGRIRVGPAGWSYKDWAGYVYPVPRPKGFHEAAYLSRFFDTIEINTSFYGPLRPEHALQWIDRVAGNPNFLFTAKLWQRFTHHPSLGRAGVRRSRQTTSAPALPVPTNEDEREVREGFDVLRSARKLGAVLLQFPISFHRTPETTAYLAELLARFRDYPLAVEVRHASWNAPEVFALLRERGAGFCNIDQPILGRALKPSQESTSPIGYFRLHGRRYDTWFSDDPGMPSHERYNYLYSEEELKPWAQRIRSVAGESRNVFVVTNNHYLGKAAVSGLQLISMLKNAKVAVPEPLRRHYPQLEAIAKESAEPALFPAKQ